MSAETTPIASSGGVGGRAAGVETYSRDCVEPVVVLIIVEVAFFGLVPESQSGLGFRTDCNRVRVSRP